MFSEKSGWHLYFMLHHVTVFASVEVCLQKQFFFLIKAMAPTPVPMLRKLMIYAFSTFYSTGAFLNVFRQMWRFGPSAVFMRKQRSTRPAILDDPSYGTHGYIKLSV